MLKSINDNRNYDIMTLDNGLKVILIQDTDAVKSVACMNVNIGSMYDNYVPNLAQTKAHKPKFQKIFGLAHFLEHLLFLGSKKYPEEEFYMRTISKYNGTTNAYTGPNQTCYYFSASHPGFAEILDIFANFFIGPLFSQSCQSREINSVNSEHSKNITSDPQRFLQVIKNLINPEHPFSSFSTGNLESFKLYSQKSENSPDNLVSKLKIFFETYYSADKMYLILLSPLSLPKLRTLANIFAHVPRKVGYNLTNKISNIPLFLDSQQFVAIKSLTNGHILTIIWHLPIKYKILYRKSGLYLFVFNLLSRGSEGSFSEYLRKNNYAYDLDIDADNILDHIIISLRINLTDKGYSKINLVVNLLDYYILYLINAFNQKDKLINISYKDFHTIKQTNLLYSEKIEEENYVMNLAHILSEYEPYGLPMEETCLAFNMLDELDNLDKLDNLDNIYNICTEILGRLILPNANLIIVSSHDFPEDKLLKKEKWYGVIYDTFSDFNKLNELMEPGPGPGPEHDGHNAKINQKIQNQIYLSNKNRYLTLLNKYTLYKHQKSDSRPYKHHNIYYQFINTFNIPYANYCVHIDLPNLYKSEIYNKDAIVARIYIACITDMLNTEIFKLQDANYASNLYLTDYKLVLNIYGPYTKIKNVVLLYIRNLMDLKIKSNIFRKIKNNFIQNIKNELLKIPYYKLKYILLDKIHKNYLSHEETLKILHKINHEDLLTGRDNIFANYKIKSSIIGNILEDDASAIANISHIFQKKYGPSCKIPKKDLNLIKNILPGTNKIIRVKSNIKNETNSALGMYFKIGYISQSSDTSVQNLDRVRLICTNNLLHSILDNEYYQVLRGNEQLGYIVNSTELAIGHPDNALLLYAFNIQSNIKDADYLLERTELFIQNAMAILKDDSHIFDIRKQTLIDNLLIKPCSLSATISRNNYHIFYTNNINTDKIFIDMYRKITIQDVIQFYKTFIYNPDTRAYWAVLYDI
jgi:insulysin